MVSLHVAEVACPLARNMQFDTDAREALHDVASLRDEKLELV